MKTVLYHSHHQLPFWHKPSQPYAEYSPARSSGWMCEEWDNVQGEHVLKNYKGEGGFVLPILDGLHALDLPLLAHVSFSVLDDKLQPMGRCWVQITTMPEDVDESGLPLVVTPSEVGGKNSVNVTGLWGFDNRTESPWDFPWAKEVSEAERLTSEFWVAAFRKQLLIAREEEAQAAKCASKKAEAAAAYAELFNSVLKG